MTGPDPYQGYPQYEGGDYGPPGTPPPQDPPKPVLNAFYVMIAGAVVQGLAILVTFLQLDTLREEIRTSVLEGDPNASEDFIDGAVAGAVVFTVVLGLVYAGLWVWMAYKNRAGRNWARITATVFFGFQTLSTLVTLALAASDAAGGNSLTAGSSTVPGTIATILLWVIGLIAIVLLWNRLSSDYFRGQQQYGMR